MPQEVSHILREIEIKDGKVQGTYAATYAEWLSRISSKESQMRDMFGTYMDKTNENSEAVRTKLDKMAARVAADYTRVEEWSAQKRELAHVLWRKVYAHHQRLVEDLSAVHDGNREFGYYLKQRRGGRGNVWDGKEVTELVPVTHPVVRVHPETGRKSLFVNPGFTSHIEGVSDAESRGILDLLYAHLTKPEHIVRHRWRLGDLVLWDNRNTLHYANRDYGDNRRVMHRITLRGDEPVGPPAAG